MTAIATREAFGAQFVGAAGYLNSPTYGLPPGFLVDALHDCIGRWQAGTMDVPSFDDDVAAGRAGYAALAGVPVESVAMGSTVSGALGLVAAAIPDGSRVVTVPGEFTSTTFPFAAQAARGVTVTELPADQLVSAAADFDVVVVSLVQSANGAVLDDGDGVAAGDAAAQCVGVAGLALPWLASLDRVAVERHTVGLAGRLRSALQLPPQASPIVSLPIDGAADRLAAAGIRASVRAGAVRVGFHLYNDDNDLDRLLDTLG
ncbi:aminotransferase [Mycolicibacterium celeriflavum]|uniref:aminotransferase n=1 Tax=Mycolicibacterium celeriflavum TaxID=1249101 RepID=UPI003CF368C2